MATPSENIARRPRFDPEGGTELGVVVARAIATVENADPTETDYRLYDTIDVDALERMIRHRRERTGTPWRVEFAVRDHHVTVWADGRIDVQ